MLNRVKTYIFSWFTAKQIVLPVIIILLLFLSQQTPAQEKIRTEELFKMTLEDLMNVEFISAGKKSEKISDIPASVVLITRADIEQFGYQSLAEILENIPGLYPVHDYSFDGSYKFGVRGFWSGQANKNIVILVNDVKRTTYVHSSHDFKKINVPVEAIDRVEVIRGPMSVMYGTGAFFGVINIITREIPDQSEYSSIVSVAGGSNKTGKGFLRLSGKSGDFSYSMNTSYFDSYGLDKPLNKFVDGLAGSSGGTLEKNNKYFDFSGSFRDLTIDFNYDVNRDEIKFLFPGVGGGNQVFAPSSNISLGYKKEFLNKARFEGKFTHFSEKHWIRYYFETENDYAGQELHASGNDIELRAYLLPSSDFETTIGINYQYIGDIANQIWFPLFTGYPLDHNNTVLIGDNKIETRAVFAQSDININNNLRFVVGVRFEQMKKYALVNEAAWFDESLDEFKKENNFLDYDYDKIDVLPRIAAIYKPNDNNILKFLYGRAITRPSFFQVGNAVGTNTYRLQPEYINTYEISYSAVITEKVSADINFFYSELQNLISRNNGFTNEGIYYNFWNNGGEVTTKGVEFMFRSRPLDNLSINFSGTYQNAVDKKNEEIEYGYCPGFLGYFNASYYAGNHFVAGVTGNYVDKMESLWDIQPQDQTDPNSLPVGRIGDAVNSYFLLGTNFRFKNLFDQGYFANLRISNLFNSDIQYPTTEGSSWAPKGTPGFGRTFLFSLGRNF